MLSHRVRGRALLLLIILVVALPVMLLLVELIGLNPNDNKEAWSYVFGSDILLNLTKNTALLAGLTLLFSAVLGTLQATLIKLTDFPFRRVLNIFFILPLAFPLYILAFIFVGGFSYSGSLMSFFRNSLGMDLTLYLSTGSAFFVAFVFSLALAPYFYLFLSSAMDQINPRWLLSARSMGHSPLSVFLNLVLRYLRPWFFSAGVFVVLDVLCDFGGVSIFGYDTFSLAVYQAWLSLYSLEIGVLLSLIPLTVGLGIFYVSQRYQAQSSYSQFDIKSASLFRVHGFSKLMVSTFLIVYLSIVILFPLIQLGYWFFESELSQGITESFYLFLTSLGFGAIAAVLLVSLALLLHYYKRFEFGSKEKPWLTFVNSGYALPGTIVAVGLLYSAKLFGMSVSGAFALTILLMGYLSRYFSVGFQLLNKAFDRISPRMDWAGQSLGHHGLSVYGKVHIPLIRNAILASGVMVAIEVVKELPLTLILRPFGVNTLATRLYQFTAEGQWEEAALPALLILMAGGLSLAVGFGVQESMLRKKV